MMNYARFPLVNLLVFVHLFISPKKVLNTNLRCSFAFIALCSLICASSVDHPHNFAFPSALFALFSKSGWLIDTWS